MDSSFYSPMQEQVVKYGKFQDLIKIQFTALKFAYKI